VDAIHRELGDTVLVGALDIGGSHAAAALVDTSGPGLRPGSRAERRFSPHADRDALLGAILGVATAAAATGPAACWGVAVPGPFDYATGRCTIRSRQKLDALYGLDLRARLAAALGRPGNTVRFGNDADAFLLGEWVAGAARGARRAVGITLGTGLGSAFLADGALVVDGTVPPGGRLHPLTYRGRAVEEIVSTRGLRAASGRTGADGRQLAAAARAGDATCLAAFAELGTALGAVLAPWLRRFRPTHVVVGGGLAGAWDLIEPAFRRAAPQVDGLAVRVAEHLADAALFGAARLASVP
jgi:glucokinase